MAATLFDRALVTRAEIEGTLRSATKDYEDALLIITTRQAGADAFITQNSIDYAKPVYSVFDHRQFLAQCRSFVKSGLVTKMLQCKDPCSGLSGDRLWARSPDRAGSEGSHPELVAGSWLGLAGGRKG